MKFRVWKIKENKMLRMADLKDSKYYYVLNMDGELEEGEYYDGSCVPYHERNYITMLSTGLFDKNNKEIYEGDLIMGKNPNFIKLVNHFTDYLMYMGEQKRIYPDIFQHQLGTLCLT